MQRTLPRNTQKTTNLKPVGALTFTPSEPIELKLYQDADGVYFRLSDLFRDSNAGRGAAVAERYNAKNPNDRAALKFVSRAWFANLEALPKLVETMNGASRSARRVLDRLRSAWFASEERERIFKTNPVPLIDYAEETADAADRNDLPKYVVGSAALPTALNITVN